MRAQDQGFEALLLTDEFADGRTTLLRSADEDSNIPESLNSRQHRSQTLNFASSVINQIKISCVFQIKFKIHSYIFQ
jgi:hypothetical protein